MFEKLRSIFSGESGPNEDDLFKKGEAVRVLDINGNPEPRPNWRVDSEAPSKNSNGEKVLQLKHQFDGRIIEVLLEELKKANVGIGRKKL